MAQRHRPKAIRPSLGCHPGRLWRAADTGTLPVDLAPVGQVSAWDVFWAFLRLGLTSFGGPVAHLGYFRAELVGRRRWLDERAYADLVGLCQFLPGPTSSQVGFALGLTRAGPWGGLAAWAGFTLPSALALILFASGAGALPTFPAGAGLLHGLGLVAVAVVAQAVWGMAQSLCGDRERAAIGVLAAAAVLLAPSGLSQVGAIAAGGLAGLWLCRAAPEASAGAAPSAAATSVSRRVGLICLVLFAAILTATPWLRGAGTGLALFGAFYRSGALVFGGGHVVLPLLHNAVVAPGWVPEGSFLAGYGAAQAVPGPLFTVAAYLGAVLPGQEGGATGAAIALFAIFLPGLLLVAGILPFWAMLRARPDMRAAMRGANAAVVGVLGAALYDPVWTGAVHRSADVALALLGFVLLAAWRAPPLLVVGLGALGGIGIGLLA